MRFQSALGYKASDFLQLLSRVREANPVQHFTSRKHIYTEESQEMCFYPLRRASAKNSVFAAMIEQRWRGCNFVIIVPFCIACFIRGHSIIYKIIWTIVINMMMQRCHYIVTIVRNHAKGV